RETSPLRQAQRAGGIEDTTLTELNVSNYVTDQGGLQGNQKFPTEFGFHQFGHEDEDSFKVEVVDPRPADGQRGPGGAAAGAPRGRNDRPPGPIQIREPTRIYLTKSPGLAAWAYKEMARTASTSTAPIVRDVLSRELEPLLPRAGMTAEARSARLLDLRLEE